MSRSTIVAKVEKKPMNPIWRGAGCLIFIFVFFSACFLSTWFIDYVTSCRPKPTLPISIWFTQTIGNVPGCTDTPPTLPKQLSFLPSSLRQLTLDYREEYPWFGGVGKYVPPIFFSLVIAMFLMGFISLIYALFRGSPADPKDDRSWQPPGPRKKKVRRCR